ncbi:CRISPR-associated protein Csx20 [Thermodesulfobacteriota bacterium B35]
MSDLFLLFNHRLTAAQEEDARQELGVERIVTPPEDVRRCWGEIPPEPESIRPALAPVFSWIDNEIPEGSFLLVQGDFGACFLVVLHAAGRGITPVYSTTRREAVEQHTDDNTIRLTHTFRHVRYRIYGR